NHSGLAHCAWWGNYFRLDNLVTADWQLGNTSSLRLGYRGEVFTTRVCGITTRSFVHSLVIGVSGQWISVSQSRMPSSHAKVVSATY
ncbi:MAG: hypothetical protein K2M76_05260, partial [Muribaculaceae bacterium]|nr:hypothetical protein [Muribaculaceae bacterium]